MRILAVDPGPTTGFCIYDTKEHKVCDVWNEDLGDTDPHDRLWYVLETLDYDFMLVERFEFRKDDRNRAKIDIRAAEYVGVCKLHDQQNLRQYRMVLVSASTIGKTAFWADDNKRVKELGLYKAKAAPHGMDALRHVLYYVTFTLRDNYWLEKLK